jgi:hypothetical protein
VTTTDTQPSEFTPSERAYIRSELDQFFSTFPTVAEGIQRLADPQKFAHVRRELGIDGRRQC